nr:unnamed protein product [Callosobruchus analis]
MPDTAVVQRYSNIESTSLHRRNVSESVKKHSGKNKRKTLENESSGHYMETTDIPLKKKSRFTENQLDNNKEIVISENDNKPKLTANGTDSGIKAYDSERKKKKQRENLSSQLSDIQEIVDCVEKNRKQGFVDRSDDVTQESIIPWSQKTKKKNRFISCMSSDYSFAFENFGMDKAKKKKKGHDVDEINSSEHSKQSCDDKTKQENNENTSPSTNTNCNQTVCKGDLASYTRKQSVPTTTDEYLKAKKINIVRIDYVTTKDASKCNQSPSSKSIGNLQVTNTPKVSLLTNTSPIKFAPELTCIEECNPASSLKSSSNQNTDSLNKNDQDTKKSEVPTTENFLKDPRETCTANKTQDTQFKNIMKINNTKPGQQCNFEFGLGNAKNTHVEKTHIPEAKEFRSINHLTDHNRDSKFSKEECRNVAGRTECNILHNTDNPLTLTVDMNTPKTKNCLIKNASLQSFLAGYISSVSESTQSIAVEDIHEKSPFVSGCHWLQSKNKTEKPKYKELSGVDTFVTLRRRKRSRRTKKNRFQLNDSITLPPETVPMPKPMITEASPSIHIKFDEDGKQDLINSKKENQNCSVAGNNTNDVSYLESYFQMIQKATPMKNMAPKVGDTIAFKVLKMSESYTPEVSAYIMGKVMEYNPSDGSIKFTITSGLEELKEPNGKLSIAENDDFKQHQHKDYNWAELIEPRLIS